MRAVNLAPNAVEIVMKRKKNFCAATLRHTPPAQHTALPALPACRGWAAPESEATALPCMHMSVAPKSETDVPTRNARDERDEFVFSSHSAHPTPESTKQPNERMNTDYLNTIKIAITGKQTAAANAFAAKAPMPPRTGRDTFCNETVRAFPLIRTSAHSATVPALTQSPTTRPTPHTKESND